MDDMRGRTRKYAKTGARQTESKFDALAQAQADASPDWNPDRKLKGTSHVALLNRAIAYSAREHGISQDQFKQLVGWA